MKVLVDTSVWSLLLRRRKGALSKQESKIVQVLRELIQDGLVAIIGPIRQELLTGISSQSSFQKLQMALGAYTDIPIETGEYELAAELSNQCRTQGIATTTIDMQICAIARTHNLAIFTTDSDFRRYADVLRVKIHRPKL